jgi:hypothetical protein
MSDPLKDKEDKAAEALITASLHVWDHEISPEQIEEFLSDDVSLSEEDEAALSHMGENPLGSKASPEPVNHAEACDKTEALLALHRKKPVEGFSEKTEKEIERKREEVRKRIVERKKRSA